MKKKLWLVRIEKDMDDYRSVKHNLYRSEAGARNACQKFLDQGYDVILFEQTAVKFKQKELPLDDLPF